MDNTYKAEEVDGIIADLYRQLEGALEVAKSAHLLLASERSSHQVELEKVATTHREELTKAASANGLDASLVDETMETLENLAILQAGGREKVASELMADPNNALRLVARVATLSAHPSNEGAGIPKSATAKKPDTNDPDGDGWDKVIEEGA